MKEEALSGFQKAQDHDAALAVYTSGTTGFPKGVLHEYGNLKLHMATRDNGRDDRTRKEERFAFIAPLNFVAFYKNLVSAIVNGMHLFIVPYATVKNPVLLNLEPEIQDRVLLTPHIGGISRKSFRRSQINVLKAFEVCANGKNQIILSMDYKEI